MNQMSINSAQLLTQLTGGIDTNSLIQELDAVNRQPIYQPNGLNDQLTKVQTEQSDWRIINSSALTLQNQLESLASSTTFGAFTVASSDSTIATATGSTGATPGTYSINVVQTGTNATLSSNVRNGNAITGADTINATKFTTPITTGAFTVFVNGKSASISVASGEQISQVINDVNTALTANGAAGVTLSLNADGSLQYTPGANTISFGTAGDSSNFAKVLGLDVASNDGSGNFVTQKNGQVQLGQYLQNAAANFKTAVTSTTSGSFSINGVAISYNTATDTLSSIINKINSSSAGVTASYDSLNDVMKLTSKTSQAVSVQDNTGNLMQALNLTTGVAVAGTQWQYSINNGPTQNSTSATVTNAVSGLTINLLKQGTTTLTVASDTSSAVKSIQDFVSQFNSLSSLISNYTGKDGDLQGDSTLTGFQSDLRTAVTSPVTTVGWDSNKSPIPLASYSQNTAMGIGISTGKVGSAVGTTDSLTVDTATLTAQIQQNPAMVQDIVKGLAIQLNKVLTNMTGTVNTLTDPNLDVSKLTGLSSSQDTTFQNMIKNINDNIQSVNDLADQEKQTLVSQFTAMNQVIQQLKSQSTAISAFLSSATSSSS